MTSAARGAQDNAQMPVIVAGAGMVGVCIALHLQQRGRQVVLLDRQPPGRETSFGNAGLIQREAVLPYAFPRAWRDIFRLAGNKGIDVRYEASALPGLLPFLMAYWRQSTPSRHRAATAHYASLIEHCVTEHRLLVRAAGADTLMRRGGWMKVFRDPRVLAQRARLAASLHDAYGVRSDVLDPCALARLEPHLSPHLAGGLHYIDAETTPDPGALVSAYFQHFLVQGGTFLEADATQIRVSGDVWRIDTPTQTVCGPAVIAMGPWSGEFARALGYKMQLGVKRGYHMHYRPRAGTVLNHPVVDGDNGYVLASMSAGIRLTTGVELAAFDAPPSPVQLARAEPVARALFPFEERVQSTVWMGRRPCTADMLPVIGAAPQHRNLWFAFGHGHQGLTLGAITGRLLAAHICGEAPLVDLSPFRVDRPSLY